MRMTHLKVWMLLIGLVAVGNVYAEETYPSRSIRIIVASAPGGNQDIVARRISEKLARSLGQSVVIDNRPGASGFLAAETVANAKPDGYTLLLATSSVLCANPSLFRKLPYDPARDFAPVAKIGGGSPILLVNPNLQVKTLAEFVQYVKSRPGEVTYGSPGIGSGQHIAGSLLEHLAQIKMLHVPYKNQPQVMIDLIAGRIDAFIEYGASAIPHINAGKVPAIAVVGPNRKPSAPAIPTSKEQGYPGFELFSWLGFVAPANTPGDIVTALNKAIVSAIRERDYADWVAGLGSELTPGSPEEFSAYIKSETTRWAKLIKDAKIEPE